MMDEIKRPCPFCGSTDLTAMEIVTFPAGDNPEHFTSNWVVLCDYCAAQGSQEGTKAKAIKAWNGGRHHAN